MTDVQASLERYSEPLLRSVVDHLAKPRTKLSADELVEKVVDCLGNAIVIDRRIQDRSPGSKVALLAASRSRQPRWQVGQLITIAATMGHAEGWQSVVELLQNGLVVPDQPRLPIPDFDAWFAAAGGLRATVLIPEPVRRRAAAMAIDLPVLESAAVKGAAPPNDLLNVPLRLAALRQRVEAEPVRLTKTGTLYKKDQTRFDDDPVLAQPAVRDAGLLPMFWAVAAGWLVRDGETLRVGEWSLETSPVELAGDLLTASFAIDAWLPSVGSLPDPPGDKSAFATASLIVLLLLGRVPAGQAVSAEAIAEWLWANHPSWPSIVPAEQHKSHGAGWIDDHVTAIVGPLGIVEKIETGFALTAIGRHLLVGDPAPEAPPAFPHTLLVQPNGEILAYRQGLTPRLIALLTRIAHWKAIGPACTLELTADQVYRGLESGLTVAEVLQVLQKHSARPIPPAVEDLVRRWGSKRERVTVFTAATLVEFACADDLDAAIARGVVSIRLTDRVGLTADGRDPDYASLRLTGNRDYEARQQPCLKIDDDGMTWTIDATFADLLLDVELSRLANVVPTDAGAPRKVVADAGKVQELIRKGTSIDDLDQWFVARSGQPMPAAVRLFAVGTRTASPRMRTDWIIRLPDESTADGVMQWPATRELIRERLGPTAVVIDDANRGELSAVLKTVGIELVTES